MSENNSQRVAEFFGDTWSTYLSAIHNDTLHHREMFTMLDKFLTDKFQQPIRFVDLGCGDSSVIAPVLKRHTIQQYIGIDASQELLQKSERQFSDVHFSCEFICEDMRTAVAKIKAPVEVIFSSYAVHHLKTDEKSALISDCKNKLTSTGFLILVDGVLAKNETREDYLNRLEQRLSAQNPNMSKQDIDEHMDHPRQDDFPDLITTFQSIATQQQWKSFDVLLDKGIFAFMVFAK